MANYSLLLSHISKWEGGLSSDPRDTCSKVPSNVLNPKTKQPYHTNKGICYSTWKANAPKLNFDPSGKGFVNMTTAQWQSIIKKIFWDGKNLDLVDSQPIAELIFETYWGSGNGGATPLIKFMQKQINGVVDGKMSPTNILALNRHTANKNQASALYKKMFDYRLAWLQRLGSNPKYAWALKGWTNRMNALLDRSKNFVTDNAPTGGVIALIGISFYLLFKYAK
jgi:type VI secretion system secreted protein VgrG